MKAHSNGDVVMTKQEFEEIKDDIVDETKFRTKVLVQLQLLRGIPNKVTKLEVWVVVLWIVSSGIFFKIIVLR